MGLTPTRRIALQSALQLGQQINLLRQSSPDTANGFLRIQSAFDQVDKRLRDLAGAVQSLLGTGNEFVADFRRVDWVLPNSRVTFQLFGQIGNPVTGAGASLQIDWPGVQQQLQIGPEGMIISTGALTAAGTRTTPQALVAAPFGLGGILQMGTSEIFSTSHAAFPALLVGATGPPTVSGSGVFQTIGDTVGLFGANRTPANSAAAGNNGEMCADNGFIYVRTGGSWRRVAVATF